MLRTRAEWFTGLKNSVEYVSLINAEDNLLYVNQMAASPEPIRSQSVCDFVDTAYHALLREAERQFFLQLIVINAVPARITY